MVRGPIRSAHLLWLLLGCLVPVLLFLDFLVGESGRREVFLQADLRVRLDGASPLALAGPLVGEAAVDGLQVGGALRLTEGRYPWRPVAREGIFSLRLHSSFLENAQPGVRTQGFVASYQERSLEGAGWPAPLTPCQGRIEVIELAAPLWSGQPGAWGLAAVDAAVLKVDLLCTGTGPDLLWGTGDERVWAIEGPLEVKAGAGG
ncbi:MAG: hypothetical protein ACI9VR_000850 [Cognaticolwellia sp.]|jgi:hypothetical protein